MNKKSIKIELNIDELTHIRDLFSVMFDDGTSISERLSILLDKKEVENNLWQKVYKLCEVEKLGVDKNAPNFLISPSDVTLGIFKAKFVDEVEEELKEKTDEKSKRRTKDLSTSQNKNKNNTLSSNRRSNKKKY